MERSSDIRPARAVRPVVVGLLLLFTFTGLFVSAYHAPRPRDLDLAVVAPPPAVAQIDHALGQAIPNGVDVHRYSSERTARDALLDTRVQGALVLAPGGARGLVAQAIGFAPTEAITAAMLKVGQASARRVQIEDVRPLPANDPRGIALLFTIVGTLIPSVIVGLLLSAVGRAWPARTRWAVLAAFALLGGLVVALSVDTVVGGLTGAWWGTAVVAALLALAVTFPVHAGMRLAGPAGAATLVLVLLPLGLSSSGGAVSPQLEPGFYGAISQLLPAGAALTALRNVVYFDWARTVGPLLTLAAWALVALLVAVAADRRRAKAAASAGRSPTPVAGDPVAA